LNTSLNLEKSFAFLQPGSLDHQVIAGNPAFQIDGRAGADIVPDHVIQVVPDPAGDADHLVSFPHVAKFVLEAAVASIEMGLQFSGAVGADEKIDAFPLCL
jgi:hypothetical protein